MNFNSVSATSSASISGWDAVSGASGYSPVSTPAVDPEVVALRTEIRKNSQDFKSLKSAFASDDLAGAQKAFQTLQQDIQTGSTATGGKSPFSAGSPIGKDFEAIGAALKTGDLAAAKQAFLDFRQDMRAAGRASRTGSGDIDPTGSAGSASPANPPAPNSGINLVA